MLYVCLRNVIDVVFYVCIVTDGITNRLAYFIICIIYTCILLYLL